MGMAHKRGGPMSMLKEKKRTRPTKALFGILWQYLKPFKLTILGISIFILIYTLANTLTPFIIQIALAQLMETPSEQMLTTLVLIFVGLSILVWVFQSIYIWFTAYIKAKFVHNMRIDTFNHLVDADMIYHKTQQSGNITARVINDTEEIATGIQLFTNSSTQILLLITTFAVLVYLDLWFAFISLLAIPFAMFITALIGTIGKRKMIQVRRAFGNVSAKLAESLSGVAVSKSFNQEKKISTEIRSLNFLTYNYMKQLGLIFMLIMPSIQFLSTLLVAIILITGGMFVTQQTMTIPSVYLGTIMVQRFFMPILGLSNQFTQLQASLAAVDRIADVLEAQQKVVNSKEAVPLKTKNYGITFENVTFAYKKDEPVLKGINLSFANGEKVALVGHTGAGKTTISAMILRFFDPVSGRILIGNHDLRKITLESLHEHISLVSQEPYLFADTVLENIRYGKQAATDEEIFEMCALIGADQFIEALPEGYNTILQESGKSLSAGQRQMITIARTMLSDPDILILDEATSRLDAYSESLVQIAQSKLFEGRTSIIIAHRLSTIRDVDTIVVLDNGQIIEKGSHDELITKKGTYYDLYKTYYAHQSTNDLSEQIITHDQDQKEKIKAIS